MIIDLAIFDIYQYFRLYSLLNMYTDWGRNREMMTTMEIRKQGKLRKQLLAGDQ